jgi:hypothetical protein
MMYKTSCEPPINSKLGQIRSALLHALQSLAPKKTPGKKRKLGKSGLKLLEKDLHVRPTLTSGERAEFLYRLLGVR